MGREREIDAMAVAVQRLLQGRDARSQLLVRLRGVGKTVLLNEFELIAGGRGFFHEHLEVSEDGVLAAGLVAAFRRCLLAMDAKRRIGARVHRALGILKAFSLHFGPTGFEMNIDDDPVRGPVRSADVARLLGRTTQAFAPARDRLIKRALCYSPRLGEIDFTVPLFGDYMKRWLPARS